MKLKKYRSKKEIVAIELTEEMTHEYALLPLNISIDFDVHPHNGDRMYYFCIPTEEGGIRKHSVLSCKLCVSPNDVDFNTYTVHTLSDLTEIKGE